jgi:hypothetical protein
MQLIASRATGTDFEASLVETVYPTISDFRTLEMTS